jgi:hypothetical protein
MGEVYRARDVRLGRSVAIKVLPQEVAFDADRLRRFEQEARAASSLNHPNIVTVYDIGECDSISFLATELVEGKTLAEVLISGALPVRSVLEIGIQIADGLAAAHEAGIVHRDLKPGNVMVTRDGAAKILDFGLAKQTSRSGSIGTASSTAATPETEPGHVMGTTGYMSPEQASGEPLDFRSDQFSFGSVLYELTTGRRAFRGKTHIDTLAAILNEEPEPIARIDPKVPAPLRWIIERCLAKDPERRYQSTRDLARELSALKEHIGELSGAAAVGKPSRHRRLARLALIAAFVVIIVGVWVVLARQPSRHAEPQFRRLTVRHGAVYRALFTPGSNAILYTAAWEGGPPRTFLTLPDSFGSDKVLESDLQLPLRYSQDGSQVLAVAGAFRPTIAVRGALSWWPALGGQLRKVVDGAGWSDWAARARLLAVVRDQGGQRTLDVLDAEGRLLRTVFRTVGVISFVRISPDERYIAFIHHPTLLGNAGEVRSVAVDGSESKSLTPNYSECFGLDWNARNAEIWFTASHGDGGDSALWAVTLSGRRRLLYVFPAKNVLHNVSAAGDRCLLVSAQDRVTLTIRRAG